MRIFKKVQILHMHIDGVWDRWMEIPTSLSVNLYTKLVQ